MSKYHINPTTGNPGQCRANNTCPFGDESDHYATKAAAQIAYETNMSGSTFSSMDKTLAKDPIEEMSDNSRAFFKAPENFVLAVKNGMVSPDKLTRLTDEQALNLVDQIHTPEYFPYFVNHKNAEVRAIAASKPNLDRASFAALAKDANVMVRQELAGNYYADADILRSMKNDSSPQVRAALAESGTFSYEENQELLDHYVTDKDSAVRLAVAQSPDITENAVNILSKDNDLEVRRNLAYNYSAAKSPYFKRLINGDPNSDVRAIARETLEDSE